MHLVAASSEPRPDFVIAALGSTFVEGMNELAKDPYPQG
jgi:hypothetical protein